MKKLIFTVAITTLLVVVVLVLIPRKQPAAEYRLAKVERGPIVATVSATGTLAAVVTVQVGTQVSGTISKLFVDFNSPVKKGQVIAQIDPSLFSARVEESRGTYLSAQGNLDKARADLVDARRNLERNRQLLRDGIIAQSDFDVADTRYQQASAAVRAAEGNVSQTRGSYSQAQTNLRYATITSPVNGIVVSRNVDVGQTVAASFQTPTLFTIAQDLTNMKIDTSVDEADISRVAVGQPVTFTVDSYPEVTFNGSVTQIRNAPIINQNVVTYTVVIGVDNKDMKLKPGMTANVTIETARKDDVLKIPSAALRFKPKTTKEVKGKPAGKGGGKGKKEKGPVVYVLNPEKQPTPVAVKTGISNPGFAELVEGNLKENDEVIIEQLSGKKAPAGGGGSMPRGPRGPM